MFKTVNTTAKDAAGLRCLCTTKHCHWIVDFQFPINGGVQLFEWEPMRAVWQGAECRLPVAGSAWSLLQPLPCDWVSQRRDTVSSEPVRFPVTSVPSLRTLVSSSEKLLYHRFIWHFLWNIVLEMTEWSHSSLEASKITRKLLIDNILFLYLIYFSQKFHSQSVFSVSYVHWDILYYILDIRLARYRCKCTSAYGGSLAFQRTLTWAENYIVEFIIFRSSFGHCTYIAKINWAMNKKTYDVALVTYADRLIRI